MDRQRNGISILRQGELNYFTASDDRKMAAFAVLIYQEEFDSMRAGLMVGVPGDGSWTALVADCYSPIDALRKCLLLEGADIAYIDEGGVCVSMNDDPAVWSSIENIVPYLSNTYGLPEAPAGIVRDVLNALPSDRLRHDMVEEWIRACTQRINGKAKTGHPTANC